MICKCKMIEEYSLWIVSQEFLHKAPPSNETTGTSALVNSTSTVLSDEMDVDVVNKRQATRVFKKSSLNGKITVYLGKRDFVDHITHVDPIGKYRSS